MFGLPMINDEIAAQPLDARALAKLTWEAHRNDPQAPLEAIRCLHASGVPLAEARDLINEVRDA